MVPPNYFVPNHPIYLQSQDSFNTVSNMHHRASPSNSTTTNDSHTNILSNPCPNESYMQQNAASSSSLLNFSSLFSENSDNNSIHRPYSSPSHNTTNSSLYHNHLPVPSMLPVQPQMTMYGYNTSNRDNNTDAIDHFH